MRNLSAIAAAAIAGLLASMGALTGCSSGSAANLAVGDCLKTGGTPERPEVTKVDCGSQDSNFKVAATVEDSDLCPADVDSYYSMRGAFSDATTTICMDIDWVVGDCIDLGGEDPQRIDCSEPAVQGEEVTEILLDTSDVNDCSTSEGGFVYRERNFVVCTDTI